MRLYQFTIPAKAFTERMALNNSLVQSFGGYTATKGEGAWVDSSGTLSLESVFVYTVATDYRSVLEALVVTYLSGIGEEAMFLAEVGTAEIVKLTPAEVNRRAGVAKVAHLSLRGLGEGHRDA